MKLFVSIDLPEQAQKKLDLWLPELSGLKKVKPKQLHLTLLFLGKCNSDQKSEIIHKLKKIPFEPFKMEIRGVSTFPAKKNPRVIWAGVEKNSELIILQQQISETLQKYTLEIKKQSFIPHITLGRVNNTLPDNFFNQIIQPEPVKLDIDFFTLKKSYQKAGATVHKVLWKFE